MILLNMSGAESLRPESDRNTAVVGLERGMLQRSSYVLHPNMEICERLRDPKLLNSRTYLKIASGCRSVINVE